MPVPEIELLLPLAAMAIIAVGGRLAQGSWLAPAAFFSLVWTLFVALNLSGPVFGVEHYDVWPPSLWWIDLCLLVLAVGSVIGALVVAPVPNKRLHPFRSTELPLVQSMLVALSIGGLFWELLVSRFVVEGDHPPMYLQLLLGFHYIAPLLGGVIYELAENRRLRVASIAVLVPGLLFALLNTGRTKVVIQLTFWFAGYFATKILRSTKPVRLFTPGHLAIGAASVVFIMAIGIIFTPFRSVERDLPVGEKLRQYSALMTPEKWEASWEWMHSSIFGHVAMFSWYFERAWQNPPSPKFPEQTAAGIYRALGGVAQEALYTEIGGISTNVFTIFKPPIEDFTFAGALVAFFVCGLISGWAYAQIRNGVMWPMTLMMFYYTNAMVIGGWLLAYNAITGAFIAVGLYLHWLQKRASRIAAPHRVPVQRRRLVTDVPSVVRLRRLSRP